MVLLPWLRRLRSKLDQEHVSPLPCFVNLPCLLVQVEVSFDSGLWAFLDQDIADIVTKNRGLGVEDFGLCS